MKKTILIIDDDIDILDAIKFLLEDQGFNVIAMQTAEELKKIFKTDGIKPDLILLDVLLSGTDGRKAARELKNNKKTKDIPIILLSAHPSAEKTFEKSEADAFLAKPFEIEDLLSVIKEHL